MSIDHPVGLPAHITRDELADMLHIGAAGDRCTEAAIGLLCKHGTWLRRQDFRDSIQSWDTAPDNPYPPVATVSWGDLGWSIGPASSSEEQILHIAASLASNERDVNLRDALTGLDTANRRRVIDAVTHALGEDIAW